MVIRCRNHLLCAVIIASLLGSYRIPATTIGARHFSNHVPLNCVQSYEAALQNLFLCLKEQCVFVNSESAD